MNEIIPSSSTTALLTPAESPDQQLIELWLHGRSRHTQRVYRSDAARLMNFTRRRLSETTLVELQSFADDLALRNLGVASQRRILAAIKSLFGFGHRLGYLPFDTGRPLRIPPLRDSLNERILDEALLQRLLAMETNPRNHVMLTLLYASGIRVSELCGLRWRDVHNRGDRVQITVFGKGGKTRTILLPSSVNCELHALGSRAIAEEPVFISRRRRPLSPSQVLRIVKAAAKRAAIYSNIVVHTFRHCHASHALDRGAPIHLVQQTLGHSSIATTGRYLHARPTESSSRFLPI